MKIGAFKEILKKIKKSVDFYIVIVYNNSCVGEIEKNADDNKDKKS